jgi:hypothetical protein
MCYQDLLAMQTGIVAKKPVTCKSKFKIYATSHSASFDPFDKLRASRLRTGRA